jgi:hypothetical protein
LGCITRKPITTSAKTASNVSDIFWDFFKAD